MTERDREPDHTEDPRGSERSDQLPEEGPAGQVPDDGGSAPVPSADAERAPDTSRDGDDDPSGAAGEGEQSTGNPDAAG